MDITNNVTKNATINRIYFRQKAVKDNKIIWEYN